MPLRPCPRCHLTFTCGCRRRSPVHQSAPVTYSLKRLRAIVPKPPRCVWCHTPMTRLGSIYQGLLNPDWDTPLDRARVREMYTAMVSAR
jgi:hypothetical protein